MRQMFLDEDKKNRREPNLSGLNLSNSPLMNRSLLLKDLRWIFLVVPNIHLKIQKKLIVSFTKEA